MSNLYKRSIEIILTNQTSHGAYLASPNFPTYQYSWFRDGAFIAYAMDIAGEHESSRRFHNWAATVISQRADIVERALKKARRGETLEPQDILHTRYATDGNETNENWPNFQLDGFGTWLWALNEHLRNNRSSTTDILLQAASLVAKYLDALWQYSCFDCWEEFQYHIHPYTLASIYAGLNANAALDNIAYSQTVSDIRIFLLKQGTSNGHFVKYIGTDQVDANLIGLATPYNFVTPDDPVMQATIKKIESTLRCDSGGIHRYLEDNYYGGGEWVLLTAWLGWYYAQTGELHKANAAMEWVETQADEQGYLAEQIPVNLNDKSFYQPWLKRWGKIAKPLLWSHAKYIILKDAISRWSD